MYKKFQFKSYSSIVKIILLFINIQYIHAEDISYIRGGMALSTGNDTVLLFDMAKGTNIPSISSDFFTEFNLMYSTDFTFNVLDVGLYAAYELPVLNTAFTVAPRIGLNYEKANMKEISFNSNQENIKGFFFSYGMSVRYSLMDDTDFYINLTDTGNLTTISYGTYILF